MSRVSAQTKSQVLTPLTLSSESPRRYRDRPARQFTSAEIRLDDDMRALFDAIRDEEGRAPTPEFERVVRGDGFPWRVFARYAVRAAKKGGGEAHMIATTERLTAFVREVFRKHGSRRGAA